MKGKMPKNINLIKGWNKGKKCPQISEANKGKHFSIETEFQKGHPQLVNWVGRKHKEESKRKQSEIKINNPNRIFKDTSI